MLLLKEHSHLTPPDSLILQYYHLYRKGWEAEDTPWEATLPLVNLASDVNSAKLGPHFDLQPLTNPEKTENYAWIMSPFSDPYLKPHELWSAKFKLVASYSQTDAKPDPNFVPEATAILTAMRLLKTGDVGAPALLKNLQTLGKSGHSASYSQVDELRARRSRPFVLAEADMPALHTLIDHVLKGRAGGKLRPMDVALRRFNLAYGRETIEDRIIDITIALESCLLQKASGELAYRFSLRGAAAVAKTRTPRGTRALLESLYDIRSKIVHEGRHLSELVSTLKKVQQHVSTVTIENLVDEFESVVREILRYYLAQLVSGKSIETVNIELEDRIVSRLAMPEGRAGAGEP
jgi:hypothetical protein